MLDNLKIHYKCYEDISNTYSLKCYLTIPTTKNFQDCFDINMGINRARDFIEEILKWSSSKKSDYFGYYSSTNKNNVDFVSAILTQAGYSGSQSTIMSENDKYNNLYIVRWYNLDYCLDTECNKEIVSFEGTIYCVKVPSKKIILRAEGFTFVSGNCHSLSNQAWQSFLKLLEEPPAKSVYIFCTTDPQKIPATILSRVQRYNFQKISLPGIVNRLKYIIEQENLENTHNLITFEEGALEYIAKLADGGMRDAITLLEKVLGYTNEITLNNTLKALGSVDYVTMLDLTDALLYMNKKDTITIIEEIHKQGLDLKQFIKQYNYFILDICKYELLKSFEYLQIPSILEPELKKYKENDYSFFNQLLTALLKLQTDIKWESSPKPLIESTLLLLCMED